MNILRHSGAIVLWSLLSVLALMLTGYVALEHYLNAKDALIRLGTDESPLALDPLVGVLAGVVPNASLATLFALTISVGQVIGAFMLVKLVVAIHTLIVHWRRARSSGDAAEAGAAREMLGNRLLWFAVFSVLVTLVTVLDYQLFFFRTVTSALNLSDTQAVELANRSNLLAEHGDLYLMSLASWGALGYLALAALFAAWLEYCALEFTRRWALLAAAIDEWWNQPLASEEGPDAAVAEQAMPTSGLSTPVAADDEVARASSVPLPDVKPVRGTRGDTVTVEHARSDPRRYHVDEATGEVWDRRAWESLHDGDGRTTEADEEAA